MPAYWLMKSEPDAFSWEMLKARGKKGEPWSGVRNFTARNNMKEMALGDLILTCSSPQSRNMSLGRALGRGETLSQALAGKLAVTEGVYTATAVRRIAEQRGIDMPISTAVCEVLDGTASVRDAIAQLMQRPLKAED